MRLVLCVGLVVVVAAAASGVADAGRAKPATQRGCLLAWNAPSNLASRTRVTRLRPSPSALLMPGLIGTDSWSKGSPSAKQTTVRRACLLWVVKGRRVELIRGLWHGDRVSRWTFGRLVLVRRVPLGRNVTLLDDGRVTKIYRH